MSAATECGAIARPAGKLGVHSLDSFAMNVSDLQTAGKFYSCFGLDVYEEGDSLGIGTQGSSHRWLRIGQGRSKSLNHLSFGVFEQDFEPMKQRLERQGTVLLDGPKAFDSDGLWFRDHDGVLIQVKVAQKTAPDEKSPFVTRSGPAGQAASPQRSNAETVRPSRLAHILLFTRSVPKAIEFYTRSLGLKLSDRSGDGICFMHGIHGSDHHLIAFAHSTAPGLHHCAWDVGGIDEIGRGAMQMAGHGFAKGWGLGRHVLGSNYFHYVRDPWGSYSEYSSDIDYIPQSCEWPAGDYPPEDSIYLWGPEMPADFVHNYEVDQPIM